MMGTMVNFDAVDADDPFPSKQPKDPPHGRPSLLPTSKKGVNNAKNGTNNKWIPPSGRESLSQRPSLPHNTKTTANGFGGRPSLTVNSRLFDYLNKPKPGLKPNIAAVNEKENCHNGAAAQHQQYHNGLSRTPTSSRQTLATINEVGGGGGFSARHQNTQQRKMVNFNNDSKDLPHQSANEFSDCEENKPTARELPPFTDSMLDQVRRETTIEEAERKLITHLETFASAQASVDRLALTGVADVKLKRLLELTNQLNGRKWRMEARREQMKMSRANFLRELDNYEEMLGKELDEIGPLSSSLKELAHSLTSQSSGEADVKPAKIMADKAVQAIPESAAFKSPPTDYVRQIAKLPASPVLRTSSMKKPVVNKTNEKEPAIPIIPFNDS